MEDAFAEIQSQISDKFYLDVIRYDSAIKNDRRALSLIDNSSEAVQLAAVERFGLAIERRTLNELFAVFTGMLLIILYRFFIIIRKK